MALEIQRFRPVGIHAVSWNPDSGTSQQLTTSDWAKFDDPVVPVSGDETQFATGSYEDTATWGSGGSDWTGTDNSTHATNQAWVPNPFINFNLGNFTMPSAARILRVGIWAAFNGNSNTGGAWDPRVNIQLTDYGFGPYFNSGVRSFTGVSGTWAQYVRGYIWEPPLAAASQPAAGSVTALTGRIESFYQKHVNLTLEALWAHVELETQLEDAACSVSLAVTGPGQCHEDHFGGIFPAVIL